MVRAEESTLGTRPALLLVLSPAKERDKQKKRQGRLVERKVEEERKTMMVVVVVEM